MSRLGHREPSADPFEDEVTLCLPEDTSRFLCSVARECGELDKQGVRPETIECVALFALLHGVEMRPRSRPALEVHTITRGTSSFRVRLVSRQVTP